MAKALYRKYRSSSLDEVVGQEHITNTLKNALKKGAISHAYLFTGPRGVGKTSVARILAHAVNGYEYDENVTQIDIIEIDAASNRRIDEIRDLRDKVNIAPTSSKYKVYIIDEVHMLTREAFNALLKTLEEPPEHVIFILATTEAHKVPETIISRTQRYSFKPIANNDAVTHLRMIADKEKLEITDGALKLIADHGRGSFRDSISMLDQLAGFDKKSIDTNEVSLLLGIPDNNLLDQLIESVEQADTNNLFDTILKLKEQGSAPANISQALISRLRTQLNTNESKMSNTKIIDIMKLLIDSTGSNSSFEQIEIGLLDSIDFKDIKKESHPKTVVLEEKVIEAITTKEIVAIEVSAIEIEPAKEEHSATEELNKDAVTPTLAVGDQTTAEAWENVLKLLKTKHNTLYGVLRMAEAEMHDGKITLIFKFEFHKKQLQQNKNMDVLHGVIFDSLGKKHDLELIVRKKEKLPEVVKKVDNDAALSSVSNIFGDAELLE